MYELLRAGVGGNGVCMNHAGVKIQIWDAYNITSPRGEQKSCPHDLGKNKYQS